MKKNEDTIFATQNARVMYNAAGEPELLMIPIRSKPTYNISDEEIVAAVRKARKDVYQELYGKAASGTG